MYKYLIGSVVLIAALFVGGYFLWSGDFDETPGQEVERVKFSVTTLKSDVSLKPLGAEEFVLAEAEDTASSGTTVRTSATGRSVIEDPDQSVTVLDRNAELTLAYEGKSKTSMELHSGAAWSRVEKVFEQGEFYEMKTENTVATVRGTSFGTYYENGRTEIVVHEGAVLVAKRDPTTGEIIIGTEVVVNAGEKAVIEGDSDIIILDLAPKDKESEWYLFNTESDEIEPEAADKQEETLEREVSEDPREEVNMSASESTTFSLLSVSPKSVALSPTGSETEITLRGRVLASVRDLFVGGGRIEHFSIKNDNEITFSSGEIEVLGTHDVVAVSTSGVTARLANALSTSGVIALPIRIFEITPREAVFSSRQPIEITIHGEGFTGATGVAVGGEAIDVFEIPTDREIKFLSSEIAGTGMLDVSVFKNSDFAVFKNGISVAQESVEPE